MFFGTLCKYCVRVVKLTTL